IGLNEISGRIYVKGKNNCGMGDSANVNVTVNPLPDNVGSITGNQLLDLCPAATNISYTIDSVGNATFYTWTANNGTITFGQGTDSITIDFTSVTNLTNIQVTPMNACGSRNVSPVHQVTFNAIPTVDICVASVDTGSIHNEIYWMRPATAGIDSFRVYRKVTALIDTLVGTVAYEDPSFIVDTLSDYHPNTNFEEYSIAAVDSCGNEGPHSAYHRTMFLSTSNGSGTINLNWNLYIGQTVDFYKIYRDTTIAGGQWELLDGSVNPSVTLWVDNNPVPNARYRVEIAWLTICDPTRGAINTSRSNIKSPSSIIIGIKDLNLSKDLNLFPNPANSDVTVTFNKESKFESIDIYDALGRKILEDKLNPGSEQYNLSVSPFAKGIYNVILSGPSGKVNRKLVVE
ncbi:MAG TPA: T9SS type A sorting domain-containing protein, partial [Bacteroidia bacterium]